MLLPVAAAAVAGLALLWPQDTKPSSPLPAQTWVHGTVTASKLVTATPGSSAPGTANPAPGTGTSSGLGTQDTTNNQLTIQITDGPTKGTSATVTVGVDSGTPKYSVGDDLVLVYDKNQPPEGQYDIRDFQRGPPLMSLAIAFALFVVVVGRWRGLGAIAALAVSFGVLVKFTLPAIVAGENSIEVAAVTAGVILFAAMYATHGVSVRTSVAVLGTAFSLVLIGALGEVSTRLAHLTGLGEDTAQTVAGLFGKVDVQGLLLAGIIIGALGVLNDVTATQVSSVWELKAADPSLGAAELFRAGMRIGRDHIGATINTLVLAYAGGSLPLFVLLTTTSTQGWSGAASAEVVAEEIVRTLVGSIGLAAAVPITTALAAYFAAGERGAVEAASLSYTDLRDRRGRRGMSDDLDDDPVSDDTLAGARMSRSNAAGRATPVPRMPESRRSGEWNADGTRASHMQDSWQSGAANAGVASASRVPEGRRSGEWNADGTPASRTHESWQSGAGNAGVAAASRMPEAQRSGEWNLDGTPASRTHESWQSGAGNPGVTPASRMPEAQRSGEWNLDGTPASRMQDSWRGGGGNPAGTHAPATANPADNRDLRRPASRPMPYPAPPQAASDPYGQSPYGTADPFEDPQYYQ